MMQTTENTFFPELLSSIEGARQLSISEERKTVLEPLINYIQGKVNQGEEVNLNFICTHNSRRSQFSQIWAKTASDFFGIPANCYSGGVEVTAFNERAVASIQRSGFQVSSEGEGNPKYSVHFKESNAPVQAFSKLFDDPANHAKPFAAVMTCSHADENCPFIPGTEQRIPVRFEDPKAFDGTPQEAEKYDERSQQIASELFYVFSKVQKG